MQVRAQDVSKSGVTYRIVDDAPSWLSKDGFGCFAVEKKKMYGDCEVWEQVYPESGHCEGQYEKAYKEYQELLNN